MSRKINTKFLICIVGIMILLWLNQIGTVEIQEISLQEGIVLEEVEQTLFYFFMEKGEEEDHAKNHILSILNMDNGTKEQLNYKQFKNIIKELEFKKDDIEISDSENEVVEKTVWIQYVLDYIAYYKLEEKFTVQEIVLLANKENAVDYMGNALQEYEYLASNQVYHSNLEGIKARVLEKIKVLLYGNTIISIMEQTNEEIKIPNIWFMGKIESGYVYFYNNYEIILHHALSIEHEKCIVDLTIKNKEIIHQEEKNTKIGGKVYQIYDNIAEIEGMGEVELDSEIKVYTLHGRLESKSIKDVPLGYNFTDFVIENEKIVAALIVKDEAMEYIRVLIRGDNLTDNTHETITFSFDCEGELVYGSLNALKKEHIKAGDVVTLEKENSYFDEGRVFLIPSVLTGKITLNNLVRNQGTPSYHGYMELKRTEEGIVAINEVLLEEYLYAVVPSEMPSSYPKEALKAQAITARTYAYSKIVSPGLSKYGAHVDDSSTFQVYNNIQEQVATTSAVKETKGEILYVEDTIAQTYYYSTSCGQSTLSTIWKSSVTEPLSYLKSKHIGSLSEEELQYSGIDLQEEENFREYMLNPNEEDYEYNEGWYRWTYQVDSLEVDILEEALRRRYKINDKLVLTKNESGDFVSKEIKDIGTIEDISIVQRLEGGIADSLILTCKNATIKVNSELFIRDVLNNKKAKVKRQDGSIVDANLLLPSSFFIIEQEKNNGYVTGYTIIGGGFGHGVGMSQNGAKNMANNNMDASEILAFFYEGSSINDLY
ncbi:MAG: SpoIID/LytB domain-containing protein [Lachnospiraceae bacterium]